MLSLHTIIAQAILEGKIRKVLRIMRRSHSDAKSKNGSSLISTKTSHTIAPGVTQAQQNPNPQQDPNWNMQFRRIGLYHKNILLKVNKLVITRNWLGNEIPHEFPERSIPKLSKVKSESVLKLTNCVWQFMSQMICSMFWGIIRTFLSLHWTQLKHTHLIDHPEVKRSVIAG